MTDPYYLSDRAIELLNKKAIRRFNEAERKVALLDFDELMVVRVLRTLYDELERDNREVFLDLARASYEESLSELEDSEEIEEITEFWLLDFLDDYNPVTKYVYSKEVPRKRDRTEEAINSSTNKAREFKRGLMYWSQMTTQYCLDVSDAARMKAFKDNGVERLIWKTQKDGNVCDECASRDGKIYPIDAVPPKAHYGDRCYLIPVLEGK